MRVRLRRGRAGVRSARCRPSDVSAGFGAQAASVQRDLRAFATKRLRWAFVALVAFVASAFGAETIPAAPRDHFNDYAGMVSPQVATRLNAQLTEFERETSNQVVVAIFPKMQSASSIEDYTVRVAQAWKVGTAERRNGAVLFVFRDDRSLYIQVGYGLEGVLPDARCKQIIENEITPRFRSGDFEAGITAGVQAMLASIRGEYQGSGTTVQDRKQGEGGRGGFPGGIIFFIIVILVMLSNFRNRRNMVYTPQGRRGMWMFPGDRGGWGGGGWGGGSSGGGGSFSGGGGSFGGGGAGGRW
jgi:uncharacterized protein